MDNSYYLQNVEEEYLNFVKAHLYLKNGKLYAHLDHQDKCKFLLIEIQHINKCFFCIEPI